MQHSTPISHSSSGNIFAQDVVTQSYVLGALGLIVSAVFLAFVGIDLLQRASKRTHLR